MNSRPVSREVYWRRRFLVLAILIALVWGVLQIVGMLQGDAAEPRTATAPTEPHAEATEVAKDADSPEAKSEAKSSDDGQADEEPVSDADPGTLLPISLTTVTQECEPENIRIQPMVAPGQRAGQAINLELLVTSLDAEACTFTPSAKDLLVVIEANKRAIYDSAVCRQAFLDSPVVLARGFGTLARTTWSGRGSGASCNPKEGFAPGGSYTINVGTYGGEPGTTEFALKKAPTPKPKPTPEPSKDTEKKADEKSDKKSDKDKDKAD